MNRALRACGYIALAASVWLPHAGLPLLELDASTYGVAGWFVGAAGTWLLWLFLEGKAFPGFGGGEGSDGQ